MASGTHDPTAYVHLQARAGRRHTCRPAAVTLAVPNMPVGDTIPLHPGMTLRVVGVVAGEEPTLIVEADTPTEVA
jgi:hypothetical protein